MDGNEAPRAHLAAIVESSTDAITTSSLEGTILSWNEGAERLYGYTASEAVGRSLRIILPPERAHELQRVLRLLKHGERISNFETVRRHKDGRLIPVALTLSPIRDATRTVIAASGIAHDVSKRRELEAEILSVAEREQRKIAQDLHDGLGQQIAAICYYANVLKKELAAAKAPQAGLAQRIADLLNDATEQTRNLARGLYPVPPDARGLMTALSALALRTASAFQIDCRFICRRPVLLGDSRVANHLYRIAQEAVANALRHGHARHIVICLRSTPARVTLGVSDDGRGIQPSKRRRKGIGLRIMHYRAELISGTLVVQHGPERGTEVVCTLKRTRHAKSPPP